MEKIKEKNKELVSLRNNYFTMLFLTAGGVAGLLISSKFTIVYVFLFLLGTYLICLSLYLIRSVTTEIRQNIERINE